MSVNRRTLIGLELPLVAPRLESLLRSPDEPILPPQWSGNFEASDLIRNDGLNRDPVLTAEFATKLDMIGRARFALAGKIHTCICRCDGKSPSGNVRIQNDGYFGCGAAYRFQSVTNENPVRASVPVRDLRPLQDWTRLALQLLIIQ